MSPGNPFEGFKLKYKSAFNQFRYSLSYVEALPQLTFLGLIIGLFTGLIIIAFRLLIEGPLAMVMPLGPDSFESLPPLQRCLFIVAGTFCIFLLLANSKKTSHQISVSHVLDRLHNHQGHMPSKNWLLQFFGGVLAIVSGQSVGREGPAIHLGAGAASRVGRWLRLPNNSRYTLIACGVAAAISASFDTPMAGVIFAMEVILMEYTIVGFVPVILASVVGTAVSQAVFGNATPLLNTETNMQTLMELPLMVSVGFLLALAAAIFIKIHIKTLSLSDWPLWVRMPLCAAIMCAAAWYVPEVMGLGYDTLNDAVAGNLSGQTLLLVAVVKLACTAIILGLGIPGGIIGPTLVVGACLGGLIGVGAEWLYATPTSDPGFYVIIGMTGMMAAVLNAPLAALVAVLELSYNPNMIFPSMLAIVVACVSTRSIFKLDGVFIEQLKATGRSLDFRPAQQALKHAGIWQAMQTELTYAQRTVDYEQAKAFLVNKPEWIILDFKDQETRDKIALRAADLATYLAEAPVEVLSLAEDVDLLAIPGRRLVLSPIHETATLWEAQEALRNTNAEGLYVARMGNPLAASILGIITQDSINNYYGA